MSVRSESLNIKQPPPLVAAQFRTGFAEQRSQAGDEELEI
jgi:hypothetical protein